METKVSLLFSHEPVSEFCWVDSGPRFNKYLFISIQASNLWPVHPQCLLPSDFTDLIIHLPFTGRDLRHPRHNHHHHHNNIFTGWNESRYYPNHAILLLTYHCTYSSGCVWYSYIELNLSRDKSRFTNRLSWGYGWLPSVCLNKWRNTYHNTDLVRFGSHSSQFFIYIHSAPLCSWKKKSVEQLQKGHVVTTGYYLRCIHILIFSPGF